MITSAAHNRANLAILFLKAELYLDRHAVAQPLTLYGAGFIENGSKYLSPQRLATVFIQTYTFPTYTSQLACQVLYKECT